MLSQDMERDNRMWIRAVGWLGLFVSVFVCERSGWKPGWVGHSDYRSERVLICAQWEQDLGKQLKQTELKEGQAWEKVLNLHISSLRFFCWTRKLFF